MGTLSSCLKKIGLSEHESAILKGSAKDNVEDGDSQHVAAVRAVADYIEMLEKERASVVEQITANSGKAPDAPFKLKDLADLTAVLRGNAGVSEQPSSDVDNSEESSSDGVAQSDDLLNQKSQDEEVEYFNQQVDDQYAKFLAGDFTSPSYVSGVGKEGREIANETNRLKSLAYAVAAKRFLEGDLVTKVPAKNKDSLNTEFIEDVKPKPIAKKLAKVKDLQTALKALNEIAADEKELRYYLRGVHFDPSGKLVATDGHRAVYVDGVDASGAPAKPEKQEAGHSYTVLGRDGKWIDGVFPDWTRIATDHKSQTETFDVEQLGNMARGIAKAQSYTNRNKWPVLRLTIGGVESSLNAWFIADMADLFRKFGYSKATISIVPNIGNGIVATSDDGKVYQRIMGMRDDPKTFAQVSSSGYVGEGKVVGLGEIPSTQEVDQEPFASEASVDVEKSPDATTKQVKDENGNTATEVTLPSGNVVQIQKLNATESMGLAGWHGPDGYLADTKEGAVKVLVEKDAKATPATKAENEQKADDYSHLPKGNRPVDFRYGDGKEPWQMSWNEFSKQRKGNPHFDESFRTDGDYLRATHQTHKKLVEQAISEGKDVPSDVLESYPEFSKRDVAKATTAVNTEPELNPLDYTPKQYHEAYMARIANEYGLSASEVREDYDTEAARNERNLEWINAVRAAARNGDELSRQTLDKLHELNDKAVAELMHDYPDAKLPSGYQVPDARKQEKQAAEDKKADRAEIKNRSADAGEVIEDFGEKLEGARKDRSPSLSKEISDDDIASQPLSKIWPAAEIDAIENKFAAAVAFTAREEIPSKPRKSYLVARWVEKVKILRNIASSIMASTEEGARKLISQTSVTLAGFRAKVALLEAIDRDQWKRIGSVEEFPTAYRYGENGEQIKSPIVRVEIDGKRHTFDDATSVADVIEKVNGLLGVEQEAKKMQFEVRGRGNSYFINKKGDKEYRKLKEFTNTKDAFTFVKENYDELVAAWEGVKDRDNVTKADVRNAENRPRTGEDRRNGQDVTKEMFENAFGFRGVQFGEWVKQGGSAKERQWMLNQAYDALMDLADIVGIPPKAISLNGSLGLAFGARGNGNAAAHFEPGKLVINLTKTQGAGTFAHEWFHALDNYFSRQRNGEVKMSRSLDAKQAYRTSNYITYRPEPMMVHKTQVSTPITRAKLAEYHAKNPKSGYYNPENWKVDPNHPEGVRPEVERAFAELVEALDASPMRARSAKNDKVTDGYWSRIIERGARAFENYVIFKMMEKGYNNDYLANVREVQDFPRAKERYPYLLPEEVAPIAEAFDGLFSTVETKETDKGIAIYNLVDFKPLTEAEMLPTGQIVDTVNQLLEQFKTDIPVTIIDREDDVLPAGPVGNNNVATTEWATSGFVYRGRIHLVREGLNDVESVASTLFHELLHYGIRRFVPEEQYIAEMQRLYKADPWIQRETKNWLNSAEGQEFYVKNGKDNSIAAARGVDEALAKLAEELHAERNRPGVTIGDKLASVVRNVMEWLSVLASKFGFGVVKERIIDLKASPEAREYVESIFKRLREGDNPPFMMTSKWAYSDPAFSKEYNDGINQNGVQNGSDGQSNQDDSGRVGQRARFWKRLSQGDRFVGDEFVQALVSGRAGAWSGFAYPSGSGRGTDGVEWSNPIAGFAEGHVTFGLFDSNRDFNVVILPNEIIGDKKITADQLRDLSISTFTIRETNDGRLLFGVSEPNKGTTAFYALLEKGKIRETGNLTADGKHRYHKVDLGYGATAKMIQETIRRYAMIQGDIGAIEFTRDTGSKAGSGAEYFYSAQEVKAKFAKDAKSTSVSPAEIRAALSERFGESGIKALESAGILKIVRLKDAPEALRVLAEEQGASALYGADGVAYLFSDRMTTEDAPGKLLHEIGEHYGLERMLGADGWGRMKKRIVAMAKAKGSVAYGAWEGVKANYTEFANKSDSELAGNERFLHEVLAALGENKAGMQTSLWREMLAAVKEWLASKGLLVDWINEGDIANLVSGSLKKAMRDAEAGLVAPEKMESLVETYFRQIVSAMKAADQLIEDCA